MNQRIMKNLVVAACSAIAIAGSRLEGQGTDTLLIAPLPEYRMMKDCTKDTPPNEACRITRAPTRSTLDSKLAVKPAAAWLDSGNTWTIAWRAPDDSVKAVSVNGGIQLPMSRLANTRYWILAVRIPGVDSAVMRLELAIDRAGQHIRDTTTVKQWRGPRAPPPVPSAREIAGTLRQDSIYSSAMKMYRGITWYLPPRPFRRNGLPVVYVADGQNVSDFGPMLDTLIRTRKLPPAALVGVWTSLPRRPADRPPRFDDDLRAVEYLEGMESAPDVDSVAVIERFRAHEKFFTEEVRRWAEDSLHVSKDPRYRAVQGGSNAGAYALTMGRKHPDLYGMIIANSHGDAPIQPVQGWSRAPRHYVSMGVLEPILFESVKALDDSLTKYRVPHVLNIYPSGHDYLVWKELLPRAIRWWLDQPPERRRQAGR